MHINEKNNMTKKISLSEPIIVSGNYYGIKLLSAYDFMLCTKMFDKLMNYMTCQGFEKSISSKIGQQACIISMCLYDEKNQKVFKDGLEAMKNLTPEEIKFIHDEYIKLFKKTNKRNKITQYILEKVKKIEYQNTMKKYITKEK